jgi:hypothetical protein
MHVGLYPLHLLHDSLFKRFLNETLCDIDQPLKPLHIQSVAIILPPFPVICPGTIR